MTLLLGDGRVAIATAPAVRSTGILQAGFRTCLPDAAQQLLMTRLAHGGASPGDLDRCRVEKLQFELERQDRDDCIVDAFERKLAPFDSTFESSGGLSEIARR